MIRIINLVDRRWVIFTSLSHRMKMYFLDPSSSMIFRLSLIKVSEIHLSLPHRINPSFVDRSSTMVWTIPSIEGDWNSILSVLKGTSVFCRSTVENDLDNPIDESKWNSLLSLRMNLSLLLVNRRQCFGQLRRSKVSEIMCLSSNESLPFAGQSAAVFRTVSPIKKWVEFTSLFSTKYLYFLN